MNTRSKITSDGVSTDLSEDRDKAANRTSRKIKEREQRQAEALRANLRRRKRQRRPVSVGDTSEISNNN